MRGVRIILTTLLAAWLAISTAFAFDAALIGQAERALEGFRTDLTGINGELQNPALTEAQLTQYRSAIEDIRAKALEQSLKLVAPLDEINQQIASLGPLPDGGKPEPADVAKQRATLQDSLDRIQGVKSRLDVLAVEAEQAGGRVSALQRDQFFQRIFEADRSIVNPMLWYDTGIGVGVLTKRLVGLLSNWWKEVSGTANPIGLGLIPLFLVLFTAGYKAISRWLGRWTDTRSATARAPDEISRLWRIVRGLITTVAMLFILIVPISLALDSSGYMTPRFELVFKAAIGMIGGTFLYYVLARRVAAPGQPVWRVIDIDDSAAARLPVLVGFTAFLSLADRRLIELSDALFLSVNYTVGQSAIMALAMLLLLSLILLTLKNQSGLQLEDGRRRVYFKWASALTPLVWLLIVVGLLALVLGYLSLASYIAQQVFRTGVVLTVLFLIHHLSDAAVAASFDSQSGFGRFFRRVTGLGERAIERLGLAFRTIVDLIVVLAGLPTMFLLWTVTWVDLRSMLNTAVFGVQVGAITISPWSVLVVLIILAGGIVLTNLVIRWLNRRILTETRIDKGVQDSIRKGASYAGYTIAAGFALTAAGMDFSNLAIIAGALGVGIGFGLQSIVNNFISGLILLAERPIKVGDWVSTAAGEGLVERINVRSTEIATFDNCSIIVPNSNLITESVKNWTHGDPTGRFTVAITVDYDSDVDTVRQILLGTAKEHPKVVSDPQPFVVLTNFGQLGLDFELKAYVAHIFDAYLSASDIRFAVLERLREKGITIPRLVGLMREPKA